MRRPQPAAARVIALVAAVGVIAGCSGSGQRSSTSPSGSSSASSSSSQAGNVAQLCAASEAFARALTSFSDSLKPGATIEELRLARDEVVKAYSGLLTATETLAQERAAAVVAAEKEFESAVNAVSGRASLPQAIESLRSEAAKVQDAVTDLRSEVKC